MDQACWSAAPNHRYWIDVILGNRRFQVMIDLGLVDPRGRVGFEIDPVAYGQLKRSGQFFALDRRMKRDASGRYSRCESGLADARVICPVRHVPVGPAVQLHVSCGAPSVPNRVGIVFFHCLRGCRVIWNLDQRIWCIEYP
jgi:hypothetical protein